MKVILVDDEMLACVVLRHILEKLDDIEIVGCFMKPSQALEFVRKTQVDLAFLDVEMPGMNGIELVKAFRESERPPVIVFVTAFSEYAMDAWTIEAADYLLKPFQQEQVEKAVSRARRHMIPEEKKDLYFHCFPSFAMIAGGRPYAFRNKKARELMAYLVHSRGNWVNNNELTYVLFEDKDEEVGKNNFRQVIFRLRKELKALNLENILITDYGRCRIDMTGCQCDYFDYLNGEYQLFHGEYLREYSWAEPTVSFMLHQNEKIINKNE